jgi:isopenicillin-N epimerase
VVAASTTLEPGDEVLINDHEYGAVLRIWQRKCRRCGARLVVQPLPVPVASADEVVETLLAGVTRRTRLLVISHVTSPTAIVLPVEAICRRARELGVRVCIDGPHALAMLPVDISRLDCDYYTASCHKWLCAPFGSGLLVANPRVQSTLEPAVVSWGRFPPGRLPSWRDEFTWTGTRDPSAFLAVPAAVEFLESVGWEAFRGRTHFLARLARQKISQLTGLKPLVPDSPQWYGSMIALPLPDGEPDPLQKALWEQYNIEVPIVEWHRQRLVRVSCHLYTRRQDVDRLVEALSQLLGQSR